MPNATQKQRFRANFKSIFDLLAATKSKIAQDHPFFDDAAHTMDCIDKFGPPNGQLALHFVSVAVAELLSNRARCAKLALLMAQALVDEELAKELSCVFDMAFLPHRSDGAPIGIPPVIQQFINAIADNPEKLARMPFGATSKVEIAPGMVAEVTKLPISAAKLLAKAPKPPKTTKAVKSSKGIIPLPGDLNRWN